MGSFGVKKKRYLLAIPVLVALIALVCVFKFSNVTTKRYRPIDPGKVNPLMGWAIDATADPDDVEIDCSLVYATVTWRELEPERGEYEFEAFEEKNHFDMWRALKKRVVLRFVMDAPGDSPHMDIPDWLYDEMGDMAGVGYSNALGMGFSPNYSNHTLLSAHRDVIKALGDRYDGDGSIAFVEIGSVGQNGSWETQGVNGDWQLPLSDDITNWVRHYTRAFSRTRLLAAKPYQPVRVIGMGLYNDRLGNSSATWDWIDTIEYGGFDKATGADFRAVPSALDVLLSGGRIDESVSTERLFTLGLDSFLKQIDYCHTTYVSGIDAAGLSDDVKSGMEIALSRMGYRLWVREALWPRTIRDGYCLSVDLVLRNDGAQSFSCDWPIEMSLMKDGLVVSSEIVGYDVRGIAPGSTQATFRATVPDGMPEGDYDIALAILDPTDGVPAVDLAMDVEKIGLRAILGSIRVVN